MGYLKGIAGIGAVLTACICAQGAATATQDQEEPDSVYNVKTDYGWTMTSHEGSAYYFMFSPLRMKVRISFFDTGDNRLRMHLHFNEVSYTDDTHNWTIKDFSDAEKIRRQFLKHCRKGAKVKHFTELAAFEEEALGYMMALSHGMAFTIDPSEDTTITLVRLEGRYRMLWTGIQPAGAKPTYPELKAKAAALKAQTAKYHTALGELRRLSQRGSSSRRQLEHARQQYKRASQHFTQARHQYNRVFQPCRNVLDKLRGENKIRLGMLWTQQIRHLAMFAQRPDYKTLAPANTSWSLYEIVERWRSAGSASQTPTPVPAFSLCGLYRWLPLHENFFAWLDAKRLDRDGNYVIDGLMGKQRAPGAWFLGTDKTDHQVEETLKRTPSGRVKHRFIKVESRLDWVDAFAILPNAKGIRGTIEVTATTTLEAALVDLPGSAKARARLEQRGDTALETNDYVQAAVAYEEYLQTYPDGPRTRQIRQQLDELRLDPADQAALEVERARIAAGIKGEKARKRLRSWTSVAENALRNDRPEIARKWLKKIVREYPQTTWAAKAQQRLSKI